MAPEGEHYQPKDAVKAAITATMVTGGAGALVSAVQNSLSKRNVGAWGILTRTGGTIGIFGMLNFHVPIYAALYNFELTPLQRQLEEHLNSQDLLRPTYERKTTAITPPLAASWLDRSWAYDVSNSINIQASSANFTCRGHDASNSWVWRTGCYCDECIRLYWRIVERIQEGQRFR
jgi:hypothetical protein